MIRFSGSSDTHIHKIKTNLSYMRFSLVKMALYMKIANELDVVVGGAFNPISGQQREVGGSLSPT